MIKNFNGIRFQAIRSHAYGIFLINVLLLAILLSLHVWVNPSWLTVQSITLFMSLSIGIGIIVAAYVGFNANGNLRERIDYLSVLITQYANGNYESRIYFNEKDELTRIANEMNELGDQLQQQVRSIQRMADEKSEFAKSAHKSAVIEERQRLARDLHDAVSQQLFALTMMSEAALKQIDRQPELAKEQMGDVVKGAQQSLAEMRALLLHLRPVHLSGDSLTTGIKKLVSELEEKNELRFTMAIPKELDLSDTIEEHVFRMIQEAFSNIIRHANAKEVKLELMKRANELFIYISDDGVGFDTNATGKKTSYGLKTMRERCAEIGGNVVIRSKEKAGTHINIRIPC